MANFLTTARRAFLSEIEDDAQIAAKVKRWFKFERGLIHRYEIEKVDCPSFALYPGPVIEPDDRYNAAYDLGQQILLVVTTEGQDPSECEEIAVLALERIRTIRLGNLLGLSSEGLKNIVPSVTFDAYQREGEAWLMWQATITAEMRWIRFNRR